jgi:hypothetical protein
MQQYNTGAPFERIAIRVAQPFPQSDKGNQYLITEMDYFTNWLEAYTIPNQEVSTVLEALVSNFLCHSRIPRELHNDYGYNVKPRLIQKVLHCLGVSTMCTTPLHPPSDSMVEC